jgi:cytochrome c biogenesis factor
MIDDHSIQAMFLGIVQHIALLSSVILVISNWHEKKVCIEYNCVTVFIIIKSIESAACLLTLIFLLNDGKLDYILNHFNLLNHTGLGNKNNFHVYF